MIACGGPPPAPIAKCPEKPAISAPVKHEEPSGLAITFAPSLDPPQLIVRIRTKEGSTERVLAARASGDVVVSRSSGFFRFYGEALPPFPQPDQKTHVTIDFDLERAPAEGVASSFGIGKHVELDIAPSELAKGVWMSGSVFTARFDAYEGKDDFSWIGYSAFDPRWVSAEIATLRTAVSQYFGDGSPPPMSMLFTMDRRDSVEASPISIYPRWHGMFAIVDLDAPWSISARMQVALALVSRFVKNPGYARYAAREILLASGTMTPSEYADEINGEIAATLFADKNPASAAIARDALDCNRKDARTMQQLLRKYVATGKMDPLTGEVTFGKCFARAATAFEELDLGFDEDKTREERKLVGVHGAALKAGLREGQPLVAIHWDEGRPDRPVKVTVTRDGIEGQVTYRPVGRTKSAQGWRVAAGIDPSSCAR